jgi:hypothetical protein
MIIGESITLAILFFYGPLSMIGGAIWLVRRASSKRRKLKSERF